MVRRRATPPPVPPVLPDALVGCHVPAWLEPGDYDHAAVEVTGSVNRPADPDAERVTVLTAMAVVRWRRARREWAAAKGVDWRGLPYRQPRWRQPDG